MTDLAIILERLFTKKAEIHMDASNPQWRAIISAAKQRLVMMKPINAKAAYVSITDAGRDFIAQGKS